MVFDGPTPVYAVVVTTADVPVYLLRWVRLSPVPRWPSPVVWMVANEGLLHRRAEGEKGQRLAQIDPRSYQATLDQYQGSLNQNQALLKSAGQTLAR